MSAKFFLLIFSIARTAPTSGAYMSSPFSWHPRIPSGESSSCQSAGRIVAPAGVGCQVFCSFEPSYPYGVELSL